MMIATGAHLLGERWLQARQLSEGMEPWLSLQ